MSKELNYILDQLIYDEIEAIVGYEKAIAEVDDPIIAVRLKEIKDEEYKHIAELKEMKGSK